MWLLPWGGQARKLSWFCVVVCGDHLDGLEMGPLDEVGDAVVGMETVGLLEMLGDVQDEGLQVVVVVGWRVADVVAGVAHG